MLKLSPAQYEAVVAPYRLTQRQRLVEEIATVMLEALPERAGAMPAERLHAMVDAQLARAETWKLADRRDLALFVLAHLSHGPDLLDRPGMDWARRTLAGPVTSPDNRMYAVHRQLETMGDPAGQS